jgi:hypothetical protein
VCNHDGYSRALFHRLQRRSGKKQAIVAVAAAMLTAIYAMLTHHEDDRDLGPHHLTEMDRTETDRHRRAQRLAKQLEHLGYQVSLSARRNRAHVRNVVSPAQVPQHVRCKTRGNLLATL